MQELISNNFLLVIIVAALWTIPWKGVALWKAARRGDFAWFVVILVVNTLAIIEILYIFIFSKKGRYYQRLLQSPFLIDVPKPLKHPTPCYANACDISCPFPYSFQSFLSRTHYLTFSSIKDNGIHAKKD